MRGELRLKLIELKCPNCGAGLNKMDRKSAVCNHCGSVFMIKDIKKEQKNTGRTRKDYFLPRTLFVCIVIGIMVLYALSANEDVKEESSVEQEIRYVEEEAEWSTLFAAFLEDVYNLPIEKIGSKQLEKMTHFEIFLENDCRVIQYRMQDGELQRQEYSSELHVDYADVGRIIGLKSLDAGTKDFAPGELSELENLTEVWCGNTPEEMLKIVNDPEKIKTLGCYLTESVAMVDNFVNLERLHIESRGLSDDLTDITALGGLKKLKVLEMVSCDEVSNFGVLHLLTGLEKLSIDSEMLKEISFVEKMDNLSSLTIEDSIILDVSPLEGKNSLVELALIDNYEITDYSALSSLTELEKLELELCDASYMPDVSRWKKLRELKVDGAQDIRFLEKLPQLECLYIKSCDCSAYKVLGSLQNVRELKMSNAYGNILDLDVLHEMTALNSLDISGMDLYGNVQSIFGIPSLESLNISDCSFGLDFDVMPGNENLKILNMNRLKVWENIQVDYDGIFTYLDYDEVLLKDHVDFLSKFPNLEELYTQGNKLTGLGFASGLTKLRKLDITGNYITDMRPLSGLKHLEVVWCGENAISQGMDLGEEVIVVSDSKLEDGWYW